MVDTSKPTAMPSAQGTYELHTSFSFRILVINVSRGSAVLYDHICNVLGIGLAEWSLVSDGECQSKPSADVNAVH